jgi:hypothetical protein
MLALQPRHSLDWAVIVQKPLREAIVTFTRWRTARLLASGCPLSIFVSIIAAAASPTRCKCHRISRVCQGRFPQRVHL